MDFLGIQQINFDLRVVIKELGVSGYSPKLRESNTEFPYIAVHFGMQALKGPFCRTFPYSRQP